MCFFQVLGFAAFFALVLKREEEEEAVPLLPGHLDGPGNEALVGEVGTWYSGGPRKLSMACRAEVWCVCVWWGVL